MINPATLICDRCGRGVAEHLTDPHHQGCSVAKENELKRAIHTDLKPCPRIDCWSTDVFYDSISQYVYCRKPVVHYPIYSHKHQVQEFQDKHWLLIGFTEWLGYQGQVKVLKFLTRVTDEVIHDALYSWYFLT